MAEKNINARIIHKHDTEANWNLATNFTPKQGEIIVYDVDATHAYERFKIGDGVTNVTSLPFVTSIGISGASVGQIIKVKEVDDLGHPIAWEAVTDSTPFIVEFSGDGSTDRPYTSSHTFEQITAAISARRYVVGHAEELTISGDPNGGRYNIYFSLVSTMDVAIFQFVDAFDRYQIDVSVYAERVNISGGYLSASSDTYGGVKADSAEEADTLPVRIGTDGKLYTAQVTSGAWTSDQISLLEVILNNIAYIDTTTGQTAANRLIASLRSGGWTSDQISLLEVILNNIAYIDTTTGQTASDRLIASLRGSGTGTSDDISQSGSVLTIRALANTPTQSESVLSIT